MDHPPDPIKIKGYSPIYPAYRGTPIGEALDSVLEEFQENRIIGDDIKIKFFEEFDKAITKHMDNLPPTSCRIEGTTVDFKFIYNYYDIFLKPGFITLDDGRTINSESIEIMALNDEEKK